MKPVNGSSTALGVVGEAVDLYEGDETERRTVAYPNDFSRRADGKVRPAPPLSGDPGEWTVVYHHVTSEKSYESVVSTGFMSE